MEPPSREQAIKTFERMGHGETIRMGRLPEELLALFAAAESLPTYAKAWLSLLERVMRLRGARPRSSITRDQLSRFSVPTLFIWGERDPFGSPGLGRTAVAAMSDARIEVIPGAGHLPWLDAPDLCAELTARFLATQPPEGVARADRTHLRSTG
jgi:pimeloyl-ACP methyl ester carboxylesterase